MENMSANVNSTQSLQLLRNCVWCVTHACCVVWAGTCRHMQAHAGTYSHVQTQADTCACRCMQTHTQTHADTCRHIVSGEELFVDYGEIYWTTEEGKLDDRYYFKGHNVK